jgi:hypothetical protein
MAKVLMKRAKLAGSVVRAIAPLCFVSLASALWAACSSGHGTGQGHETADGSTESDDGGPPLVYPLTLTPLSDALTQTANITLFFSVTDATGAGVPNLSCSSALPSGDAGPHCDFAYLEDGSPLDPTESAFDVQPVSANALKMPTVLVLQTSPSIIQNGELGAFKQAANAIISNLLPQQTLEIMTFADQATPNVRIPFTNDKVALTAAVNAIDSADGTSTNLYGTLDYALGQWTDGFATSGASGQLTAGLLIVITNGSDNAARQTLDSVLQARGNKRVIAIGIGTEQTLDTCALNAIGNEKVIVKPTYQMLSDGVDEVTETVQTLGRSIYTASYCSPKRASAVGQNAHQLTFTVKGNESYNTAVCSNAVFTASEAQACTGGGSPFAGDSGLGLGTPTPAPTTCSPDAGAASGSADSTETCGVSTLTGEAMCCPANAPYSCSLTQTCYPTAVAAAAACGTSCVLCGGTGQAMQDNQLVPGTQIVVPFNSQSYGSGQCPALWGPQCKALETCCGNIAAPGFAKSCGNALAGAVGAEAVCTASLGSFCPTGTNCTALDTCCGGLTAGSTEQTSCYADLAAANANEATCASSTPLFGAYNSTACPLGPKCLQLQSCCAALPAADAGSSAQGNCLSELMSAGGNETTCATGTPTFNTYNATACPLGPSCTQLKTCCAALTPASAAATSCASDMTYASGSEQSCANYTPSFNSYNPTACPLGPECTALGTCCAGLSGTNQTNCHSYVTSAAGYESSCASYISDFGTYPGCTGPNCTALKSCCSSFGGSGQTSCMSVVTQASGNETTCTNQTRYYCPTGTNCAGLKACCEGMTGSARDTCEGDLVASSANENSCASYASSLGCNGSGTATGSCATLALCCLSQSAQLQAPCSSAASSGNDSNCMTLLSELDCKQAAAAPPTNAN